MKKPAITLLVTGLIFFITTSNANANSGTVLMFVLGSHLIFANLAIGLAEGCLLAWRYKAPPVHAVLIMVLANYSSAWIGLFFTNSCISPLLVHTMLSENPPPLHRTLVPELLSFAVLFVVTIIIEWPYCYWVMKSSVDEKNKTIVRSLKASILAQSASYPFLLLIYLVMRVIVSGF